MKSKKLHFLVWISVGVLLLCTKSSPLYPFNDWGDANIYFTIGKGMLHGQIPYRDLYDHKGPLIYALYGLGGIIDQNGFLGIWILEIIVAVFFLLYSYKTFCLFCSEKAILLMPVYAAIIYAANHMRHGGSAEEFCLPLLAYGMYVLAKWLVKNEPFQDQELILIGITSAGVLWIKYTILGFYIGWIVVPAVLMIYKKEIKELIRTVFMIVLGVILTTIPILIYFFVNEALPDLFRVYFYNNIFLYAGEKVSIMEMVTRTFWNVLRVAGKNFFVFGMIVLGALWLILKKQYHMFASLVICTVAMILTVLTAPTVHGYYSMCFSVFCVFGICAVWNICEYIYKKDICREKLKKIPEKILAALSIAVMLLFSFFNGYNTEFLFYEKKEMPQYQFAEIINMSDNPTLLNYGFLDSGFYTVAEVEPSCKYFFEANINLREMKDAQKEVIEQGQVEFVVTCDDAYEWPLYEIVAEADFIVEGNDVIYYLYQLKVI